MCRGGGGGSLRGPEGVGWVGGGRGNMLSPDCCDNYDDLFSAYGCCNISVSFFPSLEIVSKLCVCCQST